MPTTKRFSSGLIVGRFQPFHLGHLHLIKKSLELADKIVIAIGSVEKTDVDNPISFTDRQNMLRQVLQQEKLEQLVTKIVPVRDFPNDEQWVKEIEKVVGSFEVVFGNNDWTNRVLSQAGYQTITIPDLKRDEYQGTVIRNLVKEKKTWQDRVPHYLVGQITKQV